MCVELKPPNNNTDCPVAFPFQLHLSIENNAYATAGKIKLGHFWLYLFLPTAGMSADFPDDHGGMSTDFTIEKCNTEQCIAISLHDDMMLEQVESFFVSLERTTGLDKRIILHNDYVLKEVIILDDESEW